MTFEITWAHSSPMATLLTMRHPAIMKRISYLDHLWPVSYIIPSRSRGRPEISSLQCFRIWRSRRVYPARQSRRLSITSRKELRLGLSMPGWAESWG